MGARLPDELLLHIVSLLPAHSLKNVRLTNRKFESIAAPLLYPQLFLSSHPLDLEVFEVVVQNPSLCKGVKKLIWDDTTFSESLMDHEKYFQTAKAPPTPGFSCLEPSHEGYEFFVEAAGKHHEIRKSRKDEEALVNALPRLTALEDVVLTNRNLEEVDADIYAVGLSPTIRQWMRLPFFDSMPFRPQVTWSMVNDVEDAVEEYESYALTEIKSPKFYDDQWWDGWLGYKQCEHVIRPFRGLTILLKAISDARTSLQGFSIWPQYPRRADECQNLGMSHWYFRQWSNELQQMASIFSSVRRLDLTIHAEIEEHGRETVQRGHLRRVLESAEHLTELRLELRTFEVMDCLNPCHLYNNFRTLNIVRGVVDPVRLAEFLATNRASLHSVDLWRCGSDNGEWNQLFTAMKSRGIYIGNLQAYKLYNRRPSIPGGLNFVSSKSQRAIDEFLLRDGLPPFWGDDGRPDNSSLHSG